MAHLTRSKQQKTGKEELLRSDETLPLNSSVTLSKVLLPYPTLPLQIASLPSLGFNACKMGTVTVSST